MRFTFDRDLLRNSMSPRRLSVAVLLSAFALGAQAQNKCAATGVMGGEKFVANNCAVAMHTSDPPAKENSVAIWFNEEAISARETAEFQSSAAADDKRDGRQRTLVLIMFCPGGGATAASATAVKSIDLHTNHAKSAFLGIQTVVESPKDFKVEKMSGEVKPGGTLAGRIVGTSGQTTFNLDFDVKLPAKDASAGVGCGG